MIVVTRGSGILLTVISLTLLFCAPRTSQNTLQPTETAPPGQFNPGDALRISTPLDTLSFLRGIFPIDDKGFAYIPIMGSVQVTNKTPDELTALLRTTLEQYLRYPEIQVQPLIRIGLQGGFVNPGMYHIEPEHSIWDAIALAGGTTSENGLKRMIWERNRSAVTTNVLPLLESGESLQNAGFRSGDQLLTPVDTRTFLEMFVSYVLPIATFGLSLYLGIIAVQGN